MDSSNSCEIGDSGERPDRFSQLPDSLIIAILSLLPMSDVVATMLLSKRVLAHWKGSKIHKFSVSYYVDDHSFAHSNAIVDSWLLFATEKQVDELHVYNAVCLFEYCAPQRLYSCSSLTKMSLSSCKLRIDEAVHWNRLKSLKIVGMKSLYGDAMNQILVGAPLLEELILSLVGFSENLDIRSTCLKKLKFGSYTGTLFEGVLKIWAPNLLDLEISGFFHGNCLLDVPSLTNAKLCFKESYVDDDDDDDDETNSILPPDEIFLQVFLSLRHVEKLTLSDFSIKILLYMKQNHMLAGFSNAKSLYLYAGDTEQMLRVLDLFPNLTMLWLQYDKDCYFRLAAEARFSKVDVINSDLSKSALPSPSLLYLKTVEITWIMLDFSIIPAVEILLENAELLEKMVFRPVWRRGKQDVVLSTPASSPTAEVIVIHDSL